MKSSPGASPRAKAPFGETRCISLASPRIGSGFQRFSHVSHTRGADNDGSDRMRPGIAGFSRHIPGSHPLQAVVRFLGIIALEPALAGLLGDGIHPGNT